MPYRLALRAMRAAAAVAALLMLAPRSGLAVPQADHVRIKLAATRMNVNDYSIRKEFRVDVSVSAAEQSQLDGIDGSSLTLVNPELVSARVAPWKLKISARRFKACHADIVFALVEDSASVAGSNVPGGYFASSGPYRVRVDLPGESYRGTASFGEPVALRVSQGGGQLRGFILDPAQALEIATQPQQFGPVYYKRRDVTNFLYQLASIDAALQDGDYHPPVESPRYFFQVRAGRIGEESTELLDPALYLPGAQAHQIRVDSAASPMLLPAGTFTDGQTALVEFIREESLPPDSVFRGAGENLSDSVVLQERVVYTLEAHAGGGKQ